MTLKPNKPDRNILKITLDEALVLYEQTGAQCLQEYILEFQSNKIDFSNAVQTAMLTSGKAKVLLEIIEELYIECNVLRSTAVFMRQCFADPINRHPLYIGKDPVSRLARNLIPIDPIEA